MELNPRQLIHLQVALEYQGISSFPGLEGGLLHPYPDSSEQALFLIHRYPGGCLRFARQDLPESVLKRLVELPALQACEHPEAVQQVLAKWNAGFVGPFETYIFTEPPPVNDCPRVDQQEGCFLVRFDDLAVAWAWSERENDHAAEVAVETLPDFRRRGYARQVTAAWAIHVLRQGKVAFFSHHRDNLASRALAHSLGTKPITTCYAYEARK